ncbi:MAG TPA: Yip1 family protein [Methanocorpusculum sp.]|nr:Yip1 family protein [Methanocorpusculum sp.]
MSPVEMHANEVQIYASPILVKGQQYYATLTSERLILEGNGPTREFKATSLDTPRAVTTGNNEPGVEVVLSTPSGRKEMIWTFPVDSVFKAGEQSAWIENIEKASGKADMPLRESGGIPVNRPQFTSSMNTGQYPAPSYQRGETEELSTAGVRIKRAYYTLYLTNLRLILQNNLGKIGREFSVAEITDASPMNSETGEPSIALSIGSQNGMKQMLLTFPTEMARDAWIRELSVHLPSRKPVSVSKPEQAQGAARLGTFVPAENEHLLESTKDVRIKSNFVIAHLTNTRFVIEGRAGIVGEFAVSALLRCVRMAGELGEPGISVSMRGREGDREMHLIFQSMDERERWMLLFEGVMPKVVPQPAPAASQYTVTQVTPPQQQNTAVRYCPVCGARNHINDTICGMCGSDLVPNAPSAPRYDEQGDYGYENQQEYASRARRERAGREPRQPRERRERAPRQPRERVYREKPPYNGSKLGFLTRPSDAFMYYFHETPRDALAMYLGSGALWAILTGLLMAFVLPNILQLDAEKLPIMSALADNPLLLVFFILMLFVLWIVFTLISGAVGGFIARLIDPGCMVSEVLAIKMRTDMAYAFIGWIPVIGMFIASIWSGICAGKGVVAGQNTTPGAGFGGVFAGIILAYVLLFVLGIVGGNL